MNLIKPILPHIAILLFAVISGCATNVPLTSNINDFVLMGTKTNTSDSIAFSYESNVTDGNVKPFSQDKATLVSGHPGYNLTQSATLQRMVNNYLEYKFMRIEPSAPVQVSLVINDFWIEQYSIDSTGKQVFVALIGGETTMKTSATLKAVLKITGDNGESIKAFIVSSEGTYVSGVSTGTSTSNIYRGKDSIEFSHAENINNVNNKLIMLMNAYLEELGY